MDHYCHEMLLKQGVQSQISLERWIPCISFWEIHRAYWLIKGLQEGTCWTSVSQAYLTTSPFFGHRPFSKQRNFWGTQFGKHCTMQVSGLLPSLPCWAWSACWVPFGAGPAVQSPEHSRCVSAQWSPSGSTAAVGSCSPPAGSAPPSATQSKAMTIMKENVTLI